MNGLEKFISGKTPGIISNPFHFKNVTKIWVHSSISFGEWVHTGEVEFTKKNTKGIQKFRGNAIDDVLCQIKQFLTELNNEQGI